MRSLEEIRVEIDQADAKLSEIFEKRLALVSEVAEVKIANQRPVFDKKRETEKLERLATAANSSFAGKANRELFEQIMAISRKKQYQLLIKNGRFYDTEFTEQEALSLAGAKIIYQGAEGAYSQMAMKAYFGEEVKGHPVESWRGAMEAIKNKEADYAVLPIENSSAGIVSENYDLLVEYDNTILGEQTILIEHALLGLPGAKLSDVRFVYSHPQALAQCGVYLREHENWESIRLKNTALGAKKVLEDNNPAQSAIANPLAAEIYGLSILESAVNDNKDNRTRFLIVGAERIYQKGAKKLSISFEIPHEIGSLYHILSHFIFNDLNMVQIESRPIPHKSFEYRFFVDFEGNLKDAAVQNALVGISEEALHLRILGNY
ncbi:chorismate mutase [Clostridia bacterium]|nr:chorismate mutase [Clostridia bacterium]